MVSTVILNVSKFSLEDWMQNPLIKRKPQINTDAHTQIIHLC